MIYDDYAEIITFSPKYGEFKTKIDLEEVERCKQHYWSIRKVYDVKRKMPREVYYISTNINRKQVALHRFIMNAQKGEEVDHIHHRELDNRKSNLRLCNKSQNAMNILIPITNKSGHKGVYWDINLVTPKWMAYIKINQKRYHLGYFTKYEDAVEAREKAEEKYFGEYSSNNTIQEVFNQESN